MLKPADWIASTERQTETMAGGMPAVYKCEAALCDMDDIAELVLLHILIEPRIGIL